MRSYRAQHVVHLTIEGDTALIKGLVGWLGQQGVEPETHGRVTSEEMFAADFTPEDAERVVTWLREHDTEEE